ncbi:zinc finger protein 579 [Paroedura picta]|uniref:zinc finger protein 579 n=1 Tax=Paroedura picta TaxID=143630 RepID=UPI004057BB43
MESHKRLGAPEQSPLPAAPLDPRQPPSHRCAACRQAFVSGVALHGHRCPAGNKSHNSCPVCGKAFKFAYYLARHRLTHGRQKPFRCKLCHKTFSRSAHLARHKCPQAASHSPGGTRGSQQEPGKSLPRQENKAAAAQVGAKNGGTPVSAAPNQKRVLLQEDWTLLCLVCNEAFETKGELKAHKCFKEAAGQADPDEPEGPKPHQCGVCHKNFARPWSLSRHYVVHTGEKPFSCPECGMAFRLASYLRQHSRVHAAGGDCPLLGRAGPGDAEAAPPASPGPSPKKAYECSVCGKPFKSKYDLATHFLIHTGALPFQCGRCGKRFRRLSHLKQHGVTHTAARPFQCVMCQKEFKRLADLARHRQVHEGDKPHQCGVCHKFFSRSYSLLRHQRGHLPEVAAVSRPEDYLSSSCFDSQDHSAFLSHQEGEDEEEGEDGVGSSTEGSQGHDARRPLQVWEGRKAESD